MQSCGLNRADKHASIVQIVKILHVFSGPPGHVGYVSPMWRIYNPVQALPICATSGVLLKKKKKIHGNPWNER